MRVLSVLAVLAMVLWGGWWYVASSAEERAAKAFFAREAAQGKVATYSTLGVAGFPNRLDLTVNDVALGDPETGITWKAPFAQLLGLSYNPYHFVAALPHTQTVETPDGAFTLSSTKMEASISFVPGVSFALREFVAVADLPALASPLGWKVSARVFRVASRRVPGAEPAQEVGLQVDGIAPDSATRALLDPGGKLPAAVDQVYLDAVLNFDAPIDRHIGQRPPHLTALRVKDAHVTWGPMVLSATGQLTVGPDGVPEGRIAVRAKHWREMIDAAVGLGLVKPELAPTLRNMFTELATGSSDPDVVELPLSFQKGWISIGPLPLGPAPRLR